MWDAQRSGPTGPKKRTYEELGEIIPPKYKNMHNPSYLCFYFASSNKWLKDVLKMWIDSDVRKNLL